MRESRGYSIRMNQHNIARISTLLNYSMLKTAYFVLTCPNLAPTFLNRLGRLQGAITKALESRGLTVLTFYRVHMYATRQLLFFRIFYLYKKIFDRLGQKHNKSSKINGLGWFLG